MQMKLYDLNKVPVFLEYYVDIYTIVLLHGQKIELTHNKL